MTTLPSLTEDECRSILIKALQSDAITLKSFHLTQFSEHLQGLLGDHFYLDIHYIKDGKQGSCKYFVKTMKANLAMKEFCEAAMTFEKEMLFYTLSQEFLRAGIDTSFAPRGYFFARNTIVVEDLSTRGYQSLPKNRELDLEHCQCCLETLAKFHASGIIYKSKFEFNSNELNILENKYGIDKTTMATQWWRNSVKGLFPLIDMIFQREEAIILKSKLADFHAPPTTFANSLTHNDLWSTNFLFLYNKDSVVDCKLIDYQMLRYGPIEQDVVAFLMVNTSKRFRENNLVSLINYYFEKLSKLVPGIGSCEEFLKSCENFKSTGMLVAVVDHCFGFTGDDVWTEALATEEAFRNFFVDEREKFNVQSFEKNETFKNKLKEALVELRDFLLN